MSAETSSKTKASALQRLSPETLASLDAGIARPSYDPTQHDCGIVHIGVGAFHRAHQAVYTDTVLARQGGDWRISGVALRTSTSAEQLNPQAGLYAVVSKDDLARVYRIIGAIARVQAAAEDSHQAVEQMAASKTRVVSLTITEKGYCRDSSTGHLTSTHPDIVADLNDPHSPHSAVGCIVEALRRRRERGLGPFTVMSCDNLPSNGSAVRQVVIEYSALLDDELAQWIARHTAFPSTMVDRIVPATTQSDRREAAAALGVEDHGLVVAEPFSQWVIEDQFCDERPKWQDAGAEIVTDVTPYETAKLRLLNGSHSAIAYLGALAGFEFVHEAIGDPRIADFVRRLQAESATTLQVPVGFDIAEYQKKLLERFRNPALGHRTLQVAMDGTQKLPQRLIAPAIERLDKGQSIDSIARAIAAWIRFVSSEDESGKRRKADDPLTEKLAELPSSTSCSAVEVVDAVLGLSDVFESRASASGAFRNSLVASLDSIVRHGPLGAVEKRP